MIRYRGVDISYFKYKGTTIPSALFDSYELLDVDAILKMAKMSSAFWIASRADGVNAGVNSPLTNPWVDLASDTDKANVTLVNFAGTTSDGYTLVTCPNGKDVPFIKFDGVDSYGMANNPKLDIVGTGDFAIGGVFRTGATINTGWIISKATNNYGQVQYGLYTNTTDKSVRFLVNGGSGGEKVVIPANGLLPNENYSLIVYRKAGVLKARLQNIQTISVNDAINIITRNHFRLGTLSINDGGTAHSLYSNLFISNLFIINGSLNPFTETELLDTFNAFTEKVYGL